VIGVERATRLLTYLVGSDKTYAATIRLGEATVTDDAEGEVVARTSAAGLTESVVRAATLDFVGTIEQVPSSVSAIKVNGVRSYARVRSGQDVALPARPVTIRTLEVLAVRPGGDLFDLDVELTCSSGTYVRAIARDLGARLGVGGHLTALRRTAVGSFTLAEASTLDELAEREDPVTLSMAAAADRFFFRRDVDTEEARVVPTQRQVPGTHAQP